MYKFGKKSKEKLDTVEDKLANLATAVLAHVDIGVLEGYRNKATQNEYYREGKSKLEYPLSKHNSYPSIAIDLGVYVNGRLTWDPKYYYQLAGFMLAYAEMQGISIRWGGDWDMDGDLGDQTFNDLVHFELTEGD